MSKAENSPITNHPHSTRRGALRAFTALAAGATLPAASMASVSPASLSPELPAAKAAWDHWDALELRDCVLECASPEFQAGEPERNAASAAYDAARNALLAKPSTSWQHVREIALLAQWDCGPELELPSNDCYHIVWRALLASILNCQEAV